MAGEALDLKDVSLVFLVLLDDVSICIYCRKVVIATPLATSAPKTSLILNFFPYLVLVDGKLLVLVTKYVSKGSINELSPSGVFFLFFCRPVPLKIL